MSTIKFVTKAFTYYVNNNVVTMAKDNTTGRFIKRYIAQLAHDKMINAAKNFMSFLNVNKMQATVWYNQMLTHFKSFGYNVVCSIVDGKSALTLKTFSKLV